MDLYSYVSIESFVRGCKEPKTPGTFTLRVPNLLYAKPDEITGYGLSLLRRSIVLHEEQNGIKQEFSKQNIPFFRENRRMLIGPEIEMYALSLYQNPEIPSGMEEKKASCLRLAFDYGALGEYSLSEDKYLLRCKYNEEENLNAFVSQMGQEYDKFFYDEEHTGFKRDSRFFSMLCNACLEVREPRWASEQEWRLVQFCDPVEAGYDFMGGNLIPYVDYAIPFECLHRIALADLTENSLTYSALAGFLQSIGLAPDRYLEGMLEE
ncbi:hypothetical protein [Parabacteroides hominis]|uniref:Uncharacterized protein n=1 Tax=Parabacteroides hominis TaxID=2763057 RepID=A0ABR7DK22_9BACT|nr:hypothetical protein [Parabacteroides hominis]MBC5631784.1 hypothetical protein [Parabacteroides hominis]